MRGSLRLVITTVCSSGEYQRSETISMGRSFPMDPAGMVKVVRVRSARTPSIVCVPRDSLLAVPSIALPGGICMVEEKIMLGSPVTPARLMVICRSALTFIFIIATSPEAPVEGAYWIFGDGIFRAILFRESRTRFVLATGSLMKTVGAGSVFDDQ